MAEETKQTESAVGESIDSSRVQSVGEGPDEGMPERTASHDQGDGEAIAPAENAPPEEPPLHLSEEARQPARQVRDVLKAWTERVVATGGAGRGATITARMATARALAELRRVQVPQLPDVEPVHEYLRRATSAVSQAAHDIERNRYSLHAMEHQIERLAGLEKRLLPGETHERDDEASTAGSGAGASSQSDDAPA